MKYNFKVALFVISFLCVVGLPYSVLADSGLHLGWYKLPTSIGGEVTVDGTPIAFTLQTPTNDWIEFLNPETGKYEYTWTMTGSQDIMNGATTVATISDLGFTVDFDPFIELRFTAKAYASPVAFTFNSALVDFSVTPLTNPLAYASAGMTLTGNGNGASVSGLYMPDIKSYQAVYNGSTVFGNLIPNFTAPIWDTATLNDRLPGAPAWSTIPGTVSSIQSQFHFTLSAGDSASGTSRFELMVPEPATMVLLGLGALGLLRKRNA